MPVPTNRQEESPIEISVVIPVYGCPEALPELHRRLAETLEHMAVSFEIVLVDDCCPKGSWAGIVDLCKIDQRVTGIRLSRNFGQIQAITAGLSVSNGSWVVVMDCDLQDRPENIAHLYEKGKEGFDVVLSKRIGRRDSGLTKVLSRLFYRTYSYFTDGSFDPDINNFSIISRSVVDAYLSMNEHHRAYTMFVKWLGFKRAVIELPADARFAGESSYNLQKKISMAISIITAQSDKPLRFAMHLGLIISLASFVYFLFLVGNYFFKPNMLPGWTSMICAVFLMGGLILASVGIAGIYIGNIFTEVKGRPLFIIAEQLNGRGEA